MRGASPAISPISDCGGLMSRPDLTGFRLVESLDIVPAMPVRLLVVKAGYDPPFLEPSGDDNRRDSGVCDVNRYTAS